MIDRVKRQKIKEDIMKRLDMLENDFLPQVINLEIYDFQTYSR